MKRYIALLISVVILVLTPISAMAKDNTPSLKSISFKNASIDQSFNADDMDYTITLNDPKVTPTLADYEINGSANLFITYSYDEAQHQTGVLATLEYDDDSKIEYTFNYSNAVTYDKNSNNYLSQVSCNLCEVSPKINEDTVDYKLYVPYDLTKLELTVATASISASCDVPAEIKLNKGQEVNIPITVTSSNGNTRTYNFKIVRADETCSEVQKAMQNPNYKGLAYNQVFYHKPMFKYIVAGAAVAIILLIIIIAKIAKKHKKVDDKDEFTFFAD